MRCNDELEEKKKLLEQSHQVLEKESDDFQNKLAISNEDVFFYNIELGRIILKW